MRTTGKRPSPTGLYWDEAGAIRCERHTPVYGSDTWNWGRWREMLVHDVEGFHEQLGVLPECETCGEAATLPPF